MNIQQWMKSFAAALKQDATIAAFCQLHFSKSLTVQVNQSVKNPPAVASCPIVILTSAGRGTTDDGVLKTRGVRLGICIQAEDDSATNSDGISCIPGCDLLDELTDLIEKFIVRYRESTGSCIHSAPQSGPEDMIDQDIFKSWLSIGVQLDSDYN